MPTRHKNHQIEDASRRKFDTLLPDCWVSRPKASDYGVDVEVELFEETGSATGLLFYVQLRGTDDRSRAQKTALSLEQLDYFYSLDLPTLLVRFCRPTGQIFCKWHFQIKPARDQLSQKSLSVSFSDGEAWADTTPSQIQIVLGNLRKLRKVEPHETIGLRIVAKTVNTSDRFMLESAIASLVSRHTMLVLEPVAATATIGLEVIAEADAFSFSYGVIGSLTIEVDYGDTDKLKSLASYGLCSALLQLGLTDHARILARGFLSDGLTTDAEHLAVMSVQSLSARVDEAVQLALLNGLQDPATFAYAQVTIFLLGLSRQETDVSRSLTKWFASALKMAEATGSLQDQAMIRYNRGNAALNTHAYRQALYDFNQARRLFPDYVEVFHFVEGLAGCLYLAKRYRLAACLYKRAIWLAPEITPALAEKLGEACLFAGLVEQARIAFAIAISDGELSARSMLNRLRLNVCEKLVLVYGPIIPRQPNLAAHILSCTTQSDEFYLEALKKLIREVDSLNEVANFNLAVEHSREGRYDDALTGFLICGFSVPHDDEAWCNAIKCSANMAADTMLRVMAAALESNGLHPYTLCRAQLVSEQHPMEWIEALDMIVRELQRPGHPSEEFLEYTRQIAPSDVPASSEKTHTKPNLASIVRSDS